MARTRRVAKSFVVLSSLYFTLKVSMLLLWTPRDGAAVIRLLDPPLEPPLNPSYDPEAVIDSNNERDPFLDPNNDLDPRLDLFLNETDALNEQDPSVKAAAEPSARPFQRNSDLVKRVPDKQTTQPTLGTSRKKKVITSGTSSKKPVALGHTSGLNKTPTANTGGGDKNLNTAQRKPTHSVLISSANKTVRVSNVSDSQRKPARLNPSSSPNGDLSDRKANQNVTAAQRKPANNPRPSPSHKNPTATAPHKSPKPAARDKNMKYSQTILAPLSRKSPSSNKTVKALYASLNPQASDKNVKYSQSNSAHLSPSSNKTTRAPSPHTPPNTTTTSGLVGLLVYYCPRGFKCSGWGDQQRAIVDIFLLAAVTRRRFGIILQSPCDVTNFYLPNRYDWRVTEDDVRGLSEKKLVKSDVTKTLTAKADFNQAYPQDVVYVSTNGGHQALIEDHPRYKHLLPAWSRAFQFHHFHNAWTLLMRPSPRLETRAERFLRDIGFDNRTAPLVGVHVRIGKNPSNPNEVLQINRVSETGPLWTFLQRYVDNGSHVFVASDSLEVRTMSRHRFGAAHHDTDGVILHVAKQRDDPRACQGYEDAIFDQLILTRCDVLVKSRSGFSLRAGYMRGRLDGLFFFHQGKIGPANS